MGLFSREFDAADFVAALARRQHDDDLVAERLADEGAREGR
jgi:hypothetical protein